MPYNALQMVMEFHRKMGLTIGDPTAPNVETDLKLRWDLIVEEFEELDTALMMPDTRERIIQVADALADLQYVINGAAIAWGIDLGAVFESVHTSNMTKTADNKRADGKLLKGPDYQPPLIEQALQESANLIKQHGFGDDSFWDTPTVCETVCDGFHAEDCGLPQLEDAEPPQVSRELKTAMAMKSIKEDFFSDGEEATVTCCPVGELDGDDHPGRCIDPEFCDEEVTKVRGSTSGHWTTYGAYILECPQCGRNHAIQGTLGTRGGAAPSGHAECICGKAFSVDFTQHPPSVTVTDV